MNKQQADIRSPFERLRQLLGASPPGIEPAIDLTIGAPRHALPAFVKDVLADKFALYQPYPPIRPIKELADSLQAWHERRYDLQGKFDAARMLLPLMGSREGLFSAVFTARALKPKVGGAALIPNPFYQVYAAAAEAAGLEAIYLDAPRESGYLPDLDALEADPELLERTTVLYLCSPSNPQGAVASRDYLAKAVGLARRYDFLVFADECYSELYYGAPPAGALEVALAGSGDFANVLAFNSLSKRSNLPGLRSGFIAGDPAFIAAYAEFRNVACPQMPLPVQHASADVWADEAHVEENRRLYAEKLDLAQSILGPRYPFVKPGGGFFLWLNMSDLGGGERATERFWQLCGVKVLPGAYLARSGFGAREKAGNKQKNPAFDDVRIALVHDLETTRQALQRLISVDQRGS
jgi:aspartate/methionine/tyrosine aminotransferase